MNVVFLRLVLKIGGSWILKMLGGGPHKHKDGTYATYRTPLISK